MSDEMEREMEKAWASRKSPAFVISLDFERWFEADWKYWEEKEASRKAEFIRRVGEL